MLETMRHNMADIAGYGAVGVLLMIIGFCVVDLITPGNLRHQVWVERNRNATVLVASATAEVALIVIGAINARSGVLWEGIVETLVYTVIGLAILAISFFLIDILTPGDLGEMMVDEQWHPAVWVIAVVNIGTGLILATAVN
ncbi:DUF350 domain-containing protein [Gordonia jinhuaensis]|uniref:DUF350 domain-containing protein n=1 Tax=Gordonia jinhuaensis TaxID=1517702 RepID=A0A916SYR8_9ACTN|nr:DUF350 domain-containing protein [Gordonia jinhuaensis]GGB20419.1 DUF350 domain-containing protein [Gordonia jinhuaensis]